MNNAPEGKYTKKKGVVVVGSGWGAPFLFPFIFFFFLKSARESEILLLLSHHHQQQQEQPGDVVG